MKQKENQEHGSPYPKMAWKARLRKEKMKKLTLEEKQTVCRKITLRRSQGIPLVRACEPFGISAEVFRYWVKKLRSPDRKVQSEILEDHPKENSSREILQASFPEF